MLIRLGRQEFLARNAAIMEHIRELTETLDEFRSGLRTARHGKRRPCLLIFVLCKDCSLEDELYIPGLMPRYAGSYILRSFEELFAPFRAEI